MWVVYRFIFRLLREDKEMIEKEDRGLFLVPELKTLDTELKMAWCRVTEMEIISVQPPQNNRLLVYKVGFWKEQPNPDDVPDLYVCPRTGESVFARRLPENKATMDQMVSFAINHFMGHILPGKPFRTNKEALVQLMSLNKAPVSWRAEDNSLAISIFDAQHRQKFAAVAGRNLQELSSMAQYKYVIHKHDKYPGVVWSATNWDALQPFDFDHQYVSSKELVNACLRHFADYAKDLVLKNNT